MDGSDVPVHNAVHFVVINCALLHQDERKRLITFGTAPYKDPVTQVITCPKCHKEVDKEYVFEAIEAMRFIDRVIEKHETEQVRFSSANCSLDY